MLRFEASQVSNQPPEDEKPGAKDQILIITTDLQSFPIMSSSSMRN